MREVQIGMGDPTTVTAMEKITYRESGPGRVEPVTEKLSTEQLQGAQEALSNLPFGIGDKDRILTGPRPTHEASVTIGPRSLVHNAPESEKKKQALVVRFAEGFQAEVSFDNARNVTFKQQDSPRLGRVNLIHFEPDESFKVGGEEIVEVRLVIPVEQPES